MFSRIAAIPLIPITRLDPGGCVSYLMSQNPYDRSDTCGNSSLGISVCLLAEILQPFGFVNAACRR
jgi:hypothetical protein